MTFQDSISKIMSKKLITLHPKDKIQRARDIFEEYRIHHIPVIVMDKVVGIISKGDILYLEGLITNSFDKFVRDQKLATTTVEEVMSGNVITANHDQTIDEVVNILIDMRINAIPVLDCGRLIGLVTTYDILKYIRAINK